MHRDFRVQGFRGLKDLTLSDMRPITVVTGFNNVGKTSLLEALFIHACGPNVLTAMQVLGALRGRVRVVQSLQLLSGATSWEWLFPYKDTAKVIAIEATADTGLASRVELKTADVGQARLFDGAQQTGDFASMEPGRDLIVTVSDGHKTDTYLTSIAVSNTPFGPQAAPQTQPFPTGPLLPGHLISDRLRLGELDLANAFSVLAVRGRSAVLQDALQRIDDRVVSLQIITDAFGSEVNAVLLEGNAERFVPLSLAGDGMSLVAGYLAALILAEKGIVVIDEFAAEVHYSHLMDAWRAVGALASDVGTQVVMTTHSRECILAAEKAFANNPEFICLYRLVRTDDGGVEAVRYDHKTLRGATELGLDVR